MLGHVVALTKQTPPKFFGKFAAAGFKFDRFAARDVARESSRTPEQTLAAFITHVEDTTAPPGPLDSWIGEIVVHSADIRRPLGISYTPPATTSSPGVGGRHGSHTGRPMLDALPDGFNVAPNGPGGVALDCIRGNLFERNAMRSLPSSGPGADNDLPDRRMPLAPHTLSAGEAIHLPVQPPVQPGNKGGLITLVRRGEGGWRLVHRSSGRARGMDDRVLTRSGQGPCYPRPRSVDPFAQHWAGGEMPHVPRRRCDLRHRSHRRVRPV